MKNIVVLLVLLAIAYQLFFRYEHWTAGPNKSILYERDTLTGKIRSILPKITLSSMIHEVDKLHTSESSTPSASADAATPPGIEIRKAHISMDKTIPDSSPLSSHSPVPATPSSQIALQHKNPTVPLPGDSTEGPLPPAETYAFPMAEQQQSAVKEKTRLALAGMSPEGPPEPGRNPEHQVVLWGSRNAAKASAVAHKSINKDLNGDGSDETIMIVKQSEDGLNDISVMSGMKEVFFSRGQKLTVLPTKKAGWYDLKLAINGKEPIIYRYSPVLEGYEAQEN